LRSDKKYHGNIPISMIVAVNMIALPVVVNAALIAFGKSSSCRLYSSKIRDRNVPPPTSAGIPQRMRQRPHPIIGKSALS
jgi:hypothetical protein